MVFAKDGDLYFQQGNNQPIQLTHGGERPHSAILSDDNRKIVFVRGEATSVIYNYSNLHSINTDGTQERIVIPNAWLKSINKETLFSVENFIPNTHVLFFGTALCKEKTRMPICSTSIFLADTDTGKIRKLTDLGLVQDFFEDPFISINMDVSPDGKMIAFGTMDGLKIFTLDGKVIRKNVLPFKPSTSEEPLPRLFWLPDSSGLIVALPNKIHSAVHYDPGSIPAYTIWRYTIETNSAVQIPFEPPVAGSPEVSPDGNWIVYGVISPYEPEIYLGDFADGIVKHIGNDLWNNFAWSPDSQRLIHGGTIILSLDKPPVYVGGVPFWSIDSDHFIYFDYKANNPLIQQDRTLIGEIQGDKIHFYDWDIANKSFMVIRPK